MKRAPLSLVPRLRMRSGGAALLASFAIACAGDGLSDPALPVSSDPQLAARALAFDVDLVHGTVRVRGPSPVRHVTGRGSFTPSFALLGSNEVGITAGGFTRVSVGREAEDIIRFDVSIVNRLLNADLVNPTFPAPPLAQGIFLVPFSATVTPASAGRAWPTIDWNGNGTPGSGAPFNFFNDAGGCSTALSSDCFRWEAFPALAPGETSAPRNIGFRVASSATNLTVYLIVAADIRERPLTATGGIAGTVSGSGMGPLSSVHAALQGGSATSTSSAAGFYLLSPVAAGPQTIVFTGQPAFCDPLPNTTVTVVAGDVVVADLATPCYGDIHGVVSTWQGPAAGVVVTAGALSATTDALGAYTLTHVPAGAAALTLTLGGFLAGCPNPGSIPVPVQAGGVATANVLLTCNPFTGTLRGAITGNPGGALGGASILVTPAFGPTLGGTADGAGSYSIAGVPLGSGTATVTATVPWCQPASQPYLLSGGLLTLNFSLTCTPAPAITTTALPDGPWATPYNVQLAGTPSGLTWQLTGQLPPGLQLSSGGAITGTPTAVGFFTVALQAHDIFGRSAPATLSLNTVAATPDGLEPNNSIAAAGNLGSVSQNGSITALGNFHSPTDVDFVRIRFVENAASCSPVGGTQNYTVTLTLKPGIGMDADLFLYAGSSPFTLLTGSAARGNTTESITRNVTGTCGVADAFDFFLEVRRFAGVSLAAWTLTAAMQ